MRSLIRVFLAWGIIFGAFAPSSMAQGDLVFVVNSAADSSDSAPGNGLCATTAGACTLRAAIQETNANPGHDIIEFAIGSGVQTINVGSALPAITSPVTIDGTTQPGFAGTPLIVLNGLGAGSSADGLTITAGNTTLRGLAVTRFPGDGVKLRTGGNNVLETNYVGLAADGTTPAGNSGAGVVLEGSANNRFGGTTIAQRNVFSCNTGKGAGGGMYLINSNGNVIQGNFIGVDSSGDVECANEARGIAMSGSSGNLIGGAAAGAGNLIAGNRATGVRMLGGSSNNVVQGNYLGINKSRTAFIANDRGVQIRSGNNNQVLGNLIAGNTYDGVLIWETSTDNLIQGNVIAYNGRGPIGDPTEAGFNGVWVAQGSRNRILSNQIWGNSRLAIDLGTPQSVTPNDAGDGDSGANDLQNFPVLTSATVIGTTTVVAGALNSTAGTPFVVQVFANETCNPYGYGDGRYPIAQVTVTTNAAGTGAISLTLPFAVPRGWVLSATATNPGGSTSEFSACTTVR